jgi:hypothetical protein
MAAHTLQQKVKDLVLRPNRFHDSKIYELVNVATDRIDVEAIRQHVSELAANVSGLVVERDVKWATMLLEAITRFQDVEKLKDVEAAVRRREAQMGQQPFGRSALRE